MKMIISVKETAVVRPAEETPRQRVWSSNMDLAIRRKHECSIYFFRRPEGASNFFDAHVLKEALSRVLVTFYPIAGRLVKDQDGRLEIDCSEEGVLFVLAETDSAVADLGDFVPTKEMKLLIPNVEHTEDDISNYPLLAVQVTHFKCGGASLGVAMHHNVADGIIGINLINSWADAARGLSVAVPPIIDRTLLRARDPPTPTFSHIQFQPSPSMNIPLPVDTTAAANDILKLTRGQLDQLKSKLNASSTTTYSSYVALTAHIWRCACIARELPPDQLTRMHCATDGRKRLRPPLPDGYFGNVIFQAMPIAAAGELTGDSGLARAAEKIRAAVARMDDEYLRSMLDYMELEPDLRKFIRGPQLFGCPNIGVTSWTQMPIHEANFGWGKPVFMGPAGIWCEGLSYVLPSPTGDGSISVAISLHAEPLIRFRKLFYDI